MKVISRQEAYRLINSDNKLHIVEVDDSSFRNLHLPGAVNIPMDESFVSKVEGHVSDKNAEILIYGLNSESKDVSHAIDLLEASGFTCVYGYEAGKSDWIAAQMPIEMSSY